MMLHSLGCGEKVGSYLTNVYNARIGHANAQRVAALSVKHDDVRNPDISISMSGLGLT